MESLSKRKYSSLLLEISSLLEKGRRQALTAINHVILHTYWRIGQQVVEFEQFGKVKAKYGLKLLDRLSNDLKSKYGKGFSRSNLVYMRLLYIKYPKSETLSHQLGWSHYFELLKIENNVERQFYERQSIIEEWSVRDLKRQKASKLFHRRTDDSSNKLALQKNPAGNPQHVVKDPYIFEFLGLNDDEKYSEKEMEQKIIDNLQGFLLELGRGFDFVGRQYRIKLGKKNYYVDLVLFHRGLRCFVLIDLKIGEATSRDIGQMNLYLNCFRGKENTNEPIDIILAAKKNSVSVKYALGGLSNQVFVSKYMLSLPTKEELNYLVEESRKKADRIVR